MARWWWQEEGWENIFFKRVPTGWVFQAPSPWLFGRRRHYLVSASERAEFIARFEDIGWRPIVAAAVIVLIAPGLGLWLVPTLWNSVLLTILLISMVSGSLINGYLWWTMRPLLVGVPATTERITWGEQLRAWAAVVPIQELTFFAILLAILFALSAYLTLTSGRLDIDSLIGTPLLGLMVAYCVALLNAKRKTTAGPWS